MSVHFDIHTRIEGDTPEAALAEFQKVFGGLLGAAPPVTGGVTGGALAQMAEQLAEDEKEAEIIPPAPKKTRAKKDKAPEVIDSAPLPDASNAEKTESASTSSITETSEASASDVSSVSIDDLRAKLMALSKTDGGHDTVFGILGKVGAKNASTVPEDKRAEVVALVDEALAEVK